MVNFEKARFYLFANSYSGYIKIKMESIKSSEEKPDKESASIDDYQRQLLYPAIERAVEVF